MTTCPVRDINARERTQRGGDKSSGTLRVAGKQSDTTSASSKVYITCIQIEKIEGLTESGARSSSPRLIPRWRHEMRRPIAPFNVHIRGSRPVHLETPRFPYSTWLSVSKDEVTFFLFPLHSNMIWTLSFTSQNILAIVPNKVSFLAHGGATHTHRISEHAYKRLSSSSSRI